VLDFVNTKETILKSFQPFYEETLLSRSIDVNLVYKFKDKVDSFNLWNDDDVEKICKIYLKEGELSETERGKLAGIVKPAAERYNQCTEQQRYKVRDAVRGFNRCYSYVVQIVRMFDKELHKFYLFSEYFARLIPNEKREVIDIDRKIKLLNNKLSETFSGSIGLSPSKQEKTMQPEGDSKAKLKPKKQELLENIIEKINIMFEGKFTEADRVIVETIYDRLIEQSKRLTKQAKNTDAKMFVESIFPEEFEKVAQECYVEQMGAFSKLFETPAFYKKVMEQMAQAMYASLRNKREIS
jgi:type I restriction enzyme R subunit